MRKVCRGGAVHPPGRNGRKALFGLSDAVIRFAPIDIDKQQYASVHGETRTSASIGPIWRSISTSGCSEITAEKRAKHRVLLRLFF